MDSNVPAPAPFACARRQLLIGAGVGGAVLVAAGCSSSGAASSTQPVSGSTGAKGLIALKDVPSDSAVSVQDSNGRTLLLTQSGGKLTALDSTCTHQGCTVAPNGSQLACPCHGSTFTLTGAVTGGPAPSPLHTVAVSVSGGEVVLG